METWLFSGVSFQEGHGSMLHRIWTACGKPG